MRVMSRDFTTKEKVILLILIIFLLGFGYYQFIDVPVRESLAAAEAETANLQAEITAINARIATLERMQNEISDINASGRSSYMASYNNSKAELKLLNDVLRAATQYSVSFANVTRNGDQIRRDFSLQFTAPDYDSMRNIIQNLTSVEYRCLIGNMSCTLTRVRYRDYTEYGALSVSVTATFYETMVGGIEDIGLPASSTAQ